MIQCIICEDWYHSRVRRLIIDPCNDQLSCSWPGSSNGRALYRLYRYRRGQGLNLVQTLTFLGHPFTIAVITSALRVKIKTKITSVSRVDYFFFLPLQTLSHMNLRLVLHACVQPLDRSRQRFGPFSTHCHGKSIQKRSPRAILRPNSTKPVSYTHLTLPTNREV